MQLKLKIFTLLLQLLSEIVDDQGVVKETCWKIERGFSPSFWWRKSFWKIKVPSGVCIESCNLGKKMLTITYQRVRNHIEVTSEITLCHKNTLVFGHPTLIMNTQPSSLCYSCLVFRSRIPVKSDLSWYFQRLWSRCHKGLLAKLPMFGLHRTLIKWIGRFFSDRLIAIGLLVSFLILIQPMLVYLKALSYLLYYSPSS